VVHSVSEISDDLRQLLQDHKIHLKHDTVPHETGVGIVFVILQPHKESAIYEPETRVLSVDRDGPSDQGILRKGDLLLAIDGHPVTGTRLQHSES
jgi:C-terminal processing protease CtpA/Prc